MSVPIPAPLPERSHLNHLKAQAKGLHAAVRAADTEAVARIRPFFPNLASAEFRLADAQLVIAREYGFASWSKLKAHVTLAAAAGPDLAARADALVEAAVQWERPASVAAMLAEESVIAAASLAAALVTGNVTFVRAALVADPPLVSAKLPPKGWEPLLYVCFSRLLRDEKFRPPLIETARLLIERGADVNARWPAPEWGTEESCLYGATGVNNCPELAEMLLKAGANPNDGESLYHATELDSPECLHLLMEYGGDIASHNALAHLLDREEPEWLRMMLGYAANDPARIPAIIPFALRRGRSAECIRVLIEGGVDVNRPDPGQGNLTPYQVATRLGRTDAAALLATAGADTTLTPADELLGRLARGESVDPATVDPTVIAALDAEKPTPTVVLLAERSLDAALETALAAGANPDVTDGNGWTGLHWAALNGQSDTVAVLLRHRADPNMLDRVHQGSPRGFAGFASLQPHNAERQEVYVRITEMLLDAGAEVPETASWGSPEVRAVLVRWGAREE